MCTCCGYTLSSCLPLSSSTTHLAFSPSPTLGDMCTRWRCPLLSGTLHSGSCSLSTACAAPSASRFPTPALCDSCFTRCMTRGTFFISRPCHIAYTCDDSPVPRASCSGLLASLLRDAMSASASTTIHTSRTSSPISPTTSATACTSQLDAAPYTIFSTTLSVTCPTPLTLTAAAPAMGGCSSTLDPSSNSTTLSLVGSGMRTTSLG